MVSHSGDASQRESRFQQATCEVDEMRSGTRGDWLPRSSGQQAHVPASLGDAHGSAPSRRPASLIGRPGAARRGEADDWTPFGEAHRVPLQVRFADESADLYLVHDLVHDRRARVAKSRGATEPFPLRKRSRAPGARLLRWSAYALIGALAGGVAGVLLGVPVVILAMWHLTRHARRVRRWRRSHRRQGGSTPLPEGASAERLRLRTAFWQGLLAATLGVALLALVLGRVP